MKILTYEDKAQWLTARLGKITGTRLKDIVVKRGTGKKLGYYELIAERLSVSEEDFDGYIPNETPMDRGTRLQKIALEEFSKQTGKKIDDKLVLWVRDDNESIAISPDGTVIGEEAAIETKCLASARHVEAYLTQAVPDEYEFQKLQYFIVNEKLQTLYFSFYDPRMPAIQFFFLKIERKDIEEDIKTYLEYQRTVLKEVEEIVAKLSNF
jgi:predicted phage-related endonuclease